MNSDSDQRAIQRAVNRGGAVVINGTCTIVSGSVNINNAVLITGAATLTGRSNDIFILNSDNVTVTGLTFVNGGIYSPGVNNKKRSNITVTNNTFRDFLSNNQRSGISCDQIMYNWLISGNVFRDFWVGGFPATISNPYDTTNAAIGIGTMGGLDHTTITGNSLDEMEQDGFHFFNQGLLSSIDGYTATNIVIANNVFTRIHRMAIEYQDVSQWPNGCPGGCRSGLAPENGLVIKNNYYHNPAWPYWNSYAWSIPTTGNKSIVINNTAIVDTVTGGNGKLGYGFELGAYGTGMTLRGNIVSSMRSDSSFANMIENYDPGSTTNTYSNNIVCGYGSKIGPHPHSEAANYVSNVCPTGIGTSSADIVLLFTSSNNQLIPTGGHGTVELSVLSNLSINSVQFFIDKSPNPLTTQEIQDLNSEFAKDRKWLYHATIDASGLGAGTHAITAKATDLSGASRSISQTFSKRSH